MRVGGTSDMVKGLLSRSPEDRQQTKAVEGKEVRSGNTRRLRRWWYLSKDK